MFVININNVLSLPIKLEQDLWNFKVWHVFYSFVGKQELIMINLSKSFKNPWILEPPEGLF